MSYGGYCDKKKWDEQFCLSHLKNFVVAMTSENQENHTTNTDKDTVWYAAALNVWTTTHFELDRTILSFSSVGIGLLLTLASTIGHLCIWVFIIACVAFPLSVLSLLCVWKCSEVYMGECLNQTTSKNPDKWKKMGKWLNIFDLVAKISFGVGLLCLAVLAIIAGFQKGH